MGKTRKDAQQQAAENALHSLAGKTRHLHSPLYHVIRNACAPYISGIQFCSSVCFCDYSTSSLALYSMLGLLYDCRQWNCSIHRCYWWLCSHLILLLTFSLAVAENYVSYVAPHSTGVDNDFDRLCLEKENGFLWDIVKPGSEELLVNNGFPKQNNSEVGTLDNTSHDWSDLLAQNIWDAWIRAVRMFQDQEWWLSWDKPLLWIYCHQIWEQKTRNGRLSCFISQLVSSMLQNTCLGGKKFDESGPNSPLLSKNCVRSIPSSNTISM